MHRASVTIQLLMKKGRMRSNVRETFILLLTYSFTACTDSASCGGKLTDPEGNITSPNYPKQYPAGAFCFWEILAPPRDIIVLEFHDFELEYASKGCDYDYVIVVDGNSELRYCGYELPPAVRSHGYKLTVGFVTDTNSQHKGFFASYRIVNALEPWITSTVTQPPTTTRVYEECGGNIYDSGATILSPGYPNNYPDNAVCIWNISPRFSKTIYMTIDLLDIDDSNQCADDYLQMLDADLNMLGRFCGPVAPSVVIIAEKRMTVVFKSDDHVSKRGFRLSYTEKEAEVQSNISYTFPTTNNPTTIISKPTGTKDTAATVKENVDTTTISNDKRSSNMKNTGIGVGCVILIVIILLIVAYFLRKRKQPNSLLGRADYSNMAPPLPYGSDNMAAKPYPDPDGVSNDGYDVVRDADESNLSEISTPWGTAKRSQLREISPQYFGTGSRPQLGLPETRIEADHSTINA